MTRDEVLECVKRNICEVIPEMVGEEIKEEDELLDLGANSVDRAEIINLVTEELTLCLPRTELFGTKRVGEIVNVFYNKCNE